MEPTNQGEVKLSQAIQIDKGKIQEHLGEVVRSTAEETLNAMLDAKWTACADPSATNARKREKIRE